MCVYIYIYIYVLCIYIYICNVFVLLGLRLGLVADDLLAGGDVAVVQVLAGRDRTGSNNNNNK